MVGWFTLRSRIRNLFLLRPDGSRAATLVDRAELLLDAHLQPRPSKPKTWPARVQHPPPLPVLGTGYRSQWTRSKRQCCRPPLRRLGRDRISTVDGYTFPPRAVSGCLPQGSPSSPILLMLFMAPLLEKRMLNHTSRLRRVYANDIVLVAVSDSPGQNVTALSADLADCIIWCRANAIPIDADKSGLIHFSRRIQIDNPPVVIAPPGRRARRASVDRRLLRQKADL